MEKDEIHTLINDVRSDLFELIKQLDEGKNPHAIFEDAWFACEKITSIEI